MKWLILIALTLTTALSGFGSIETRCKGEPLARVNNNDPFPKTEATVGAGASLVVHEWGTFTSFSGSDGKRLNFLHKEGDLPSFVYHPFDELTKSGRAFNSL